MKFNKSDLIHMENLMKCTRNGSFTLGGLEVLAFAECIKWLAAVNLLAKKEVDDESPSPMVIEPLKEVVTFPPSPLKEIQDIIKEDSKTRKKK